MLYDDFPHGVSLGGRSLPRAPRSIAIFAVFVAFTDITVRTLGPLVVVVGGMVGHDILDERYDLPNGTNVLIYGLTVVAGVLLTVFGRTPLVGSILSLAGLWVIFDGATTIRYEPRQSPHEYVSDIDGRSTGEVMLRMQTLNVVYQALRSADDLRTVSSLAADVGLTESRVDSALRFLEAKGQIDRRGDRYRAKPPRWGGRR